MTTKKATSAPGKQSPAKKASAKKATAKAAPAKAAPPKKSPARQPAANTSAAKKAPAKKAPAKKSKSSPDDYTNPDLREKLKAEIIAGDKGGRAGQWSARKAQLLAHEYEAQGGGYKHPRNATQQSLKKWGEEDWHTKDGKPAIEGDKTHRYLPDAAWQDLSPEERKATDQKKVAASKHGKQFVANTKPAAKARKRAVKPKD